MKRRTTSNSELYCCTGGIYVDGGDCAIPESCNIGEAYYEITGEVYDFPGLVKRMGQKKANDHANAIIDKWWDKQRDQLKPAHRKIAKWFAKLPEDGGYRFRAGITAGKAWAGVSVEFQHASDHVYDNYPTIDPGAFLYWGRIEAVAEQFDAYINEVDDSPLNNFSWNPDVTTAEKAKEIIDAAKQRHPRTISFWEPWKNRVCHWGPGNKEFVRQVDVLIPIPLFCSESAVKRILTAFYDALGGGAPAVRRAFLYTTVNVI